ncbi:MAG: efflux RND transporter periplasmic adaptor subunit [bacterium]
MRKKYAVLIVALFIAVGAASCSKHEKKSETRNEASQPAVEVAVIQVAPEIVADVYKAVGTVQSGKRSALSAKAMGAIMGVYANEGDVVSAGQLLVKIDSRDIESQVQQAQSAVLEAQRAIQEVDDGISAAQYGLTSAQANRDLAEKTFARYDKLRQDKSVSEQEFDQVAAQKRMADAEAQRASSYIDSLKAKRRQVESKIDQAKQGVRQAEIMRGFASVYAPFNGVIVQKIAEPGQMATPGAPLYMIEDNTNYRLETQVEENFLKYVTVGQRVPVEIDSLQDGNLEGVVNEIAAAVDPSSRSFTVKIKLPAAHNMRSGLYGKANFKRGEISVLSVPETAVLLRGQITGVFVIQKETAEFRLVKTGRKLPGGMVEILSGLSGGDIIAVNNTDRLFDGGKVTVAK